jgi:hypothetical protein
MARAFLTAIDLGKNELQNAVVQNLGTAPGTPGKGQIYFDSGGNILYWYNGSGWVAAQGGAGAVPATTVTTQAVGDAGVVGVAITYAREDHKHGREAFAAVTAQTAFGAASSNGAAATLPRSDHTHGTPTHDAAAHSAIPLSALAAAAANYSMGGFKLTSLGTPTTGTDAVTKDYADNLSAGLSWKEAARAGLTTNRALTGLTATDGVTPVANERILLMGQTAPAENGLWLAQSGAWTRPTDYDAAGEAEGAVVFVLEGTLNGDKAFVCTTNAPITIGTTGTVWVQFGGGAVYSAGAGLVGTNTFDVVAGDTSLTVAADDVRVNTAVIATVASVALKADKTITLTAGAGLAAAGTGDLSANRTFDVGAGTGIAVAADSVALDTTYTDGRYMRKSLFNCAAATTTTCNHALNTRDVKVVVYRNSTPWDDVDVDVERPDVNNVLVRFAVAPAASAFRIVIEG